MLDQEAAPFVASQKTHRAPAWMPSNQALVWAFMSLGIALRLRQYLFDRSLWNDETELVMNILRLSPTELLEPLNRGQIAPVGFLWLEKFSVHYLGTSEIALRLVPLLCGVSSLFLFLAVARRFLTAGAIPIAVALFAISDPVIYYASEVKQYSSDMVVALLLYLVMDALFAAHLRVRSAIIAALVGGVAVWCSLSAVFILVGIGLAAAWVTARRGSRSFLLLAIPAIVWTGNWFLYYVISLRKSAIIYHGLREYWQAAFAPLPPTSVADVLWYESTFFDLFRSPAGLTLVGIAAVAAFLGANEFRKRDDGKFLVLILPIVAALLASSFHRYPFQGRLLLFLTPSLLLFVAAGLEAVKQMTWEVARPLGALLIGLLFLDPMLTAARHFVKPQGVEEVRSAIDYIQSHRSPEDILYCYYSAELPLQYYRERGRIGTIEQITGVASRENWQRYSDDLDRLRGQKRVWILFSHVWHSAGADEQAIFLSHLDRIGRRLDSMQATGASAYLYDLSSDRAGIQ
jgi:hypothetical protein